MSDKDWMDELLHAHRPAPVADDGFTEHLLAQLPARRKPAPLWLVPAAAVIGMGLAVLVSGAAVDVISAAQSLFTDHRMSLAAFLPVLLVFAGCAWALSESR